MDESDDQTLPSEICLPPLTPTQPGLSPVGDPLHWHFCVIPVYKYEIEGRPMMVNRLEVEVEASLRPIIYSEKSPQNMWHFSTGQSK